MSGAVRAGVSSEILEPASARHIREQRGSSPPDALRASSGQPLFGPRTEPSVSASAASSARGVLEGQV
jgi:hypothetical protein